MKQQLINFFKIIRWKNVLIYMLLQALLYFAFFDRSFSIKDGWLFLTLSILSFGIFGNIHNNIVDYELDQQKKDFTPFNTAAYTIWALIFIILGFLFGFVAFYLTFSPTLLYYIIFFPVALALYNLFLQKLPLIGNLIIAILGVLSVFIPIAHTKGIDYHLETFYFLMEMAFLLTLMREIIKDIEDYEIDKRFNYKTLPVISWKTAFSIYGFLNIMYFVLLFIYKDSLTQFSFYTLIITGLTSWVIATKLLREKKYHQISLMIKFMMLIGFLAVTLLS